MEVAFLQFAIRPKSIQVEPFLVSLKDHKVTSTYFIHDFLTYWGISISQFLIFIRTSGMLIAPRHKKRNPSVTQIHKKRNRKHKVYICKLRNDNLVKHQVLPDIVIGRSSTCVIPIALGGKSG